MDFVEFGVGMAFSIKVSKVLEYRGQRSGVGSKSGKRWLSLVFEDDDSSQVEISVPSELQDELDGAFSKGDYVSCDFRCVAKGDGSSYVMFTDVPLVVDENGEVGF